MKNKLNLLVWALGLLIVSSCGVPDPEKVAEEFIEIEKERLELKIEREELRQELIKTHDKKMKIRKVKNPNYSGEEWDDKYIEEYYKQIDDWDEHVNLQEKIREIYNELDELEEEQSQKYMDAVTSCDDQDEADDWIEDYEDELKDLREDLEDLEEDLQKEYERTNEKEDSYYTYDD